MIVPSHWAEEWQMAWMYLAVAGICEIGRSVGLKPGRWRGRGR